MKKKSWLMAAVIVLTAAYLLLLDQIPSEVKVQKGEEVILQTGLPLKLERREKEEEATLASVVFGKTGIRTDAKKEQYILSCKILGIFPIKEIYVEETGREDLIPGGIPVGIYVKTRGILVIGTSPVTSAAGGRLEPARYLLKSGDYIHSVNGQKVTTKEELVDQINQNGSEKIVLGLERNDEEIEIAVDAVMAQDQSYKLGVWVRDDLAGVGTMTYAKEGGDYAALGHGVSDADTSTLIDMEKGLLYQTNIVGIVKGKKGTPGELNGVINYSSQYCLGSVEKNTKVGVYGRLDRLPSEISQAKKLPAGYKQEVRRGRAQLICTLEGERKSYEIEITEINYNSREVNKGIQFVVTDQELLSLTGGIVQGMSGSPIVQNGKLIGAVTHVFVQDATKGYGIFVEEMLEKAG